MCAFPTDWGRKCELVIQHGQVSATLSNFPVLITEATLPSEIFDADGSYPAINGGGDIRFSSNSDGSTQLPCEIEQFVTDNDPANGKAAIWVKVASLASASNTSIWIWYNKSGESQPAEDSAYGKEAAWNSNYKIVQHMNQDPSGSPPQMIDSTSNDNDGTSAGTMLTEDLVDAQIGKGLDFDGSNDNVGVGSGGTLDVNSAVTISAWVKSPVTTGIQIFGSDDAGALNYGIRFDLNAGNLRLGLGNGSSHIDVGESYSANTLHYVVGTWDGTTIYTYVDNAKSGGTAFSGTISYTGSSTPYKIGARATGEAFFDGIIDEVRISDTARSDGWIETEYNNQNSPSTFIIEGTPETPGGGPAVNAPTGVFYGPLYGPFMGPIG